MQLFCVEDGLGWTLTTYLLSRVGGLLTGRFRGSLSRAYWGNPNIRVTSRNLRLTY